MFYLSFSALCMTAFYLILQALRNTRLAVSTFSVTTSFITSYLTFCRSPYYAPAYAVNDLVLLAFGLIAPTQFLM